jgi:hypothetical protein
MSNDYQFKSLIINVIREMILEDARGFAIDMARKTVPSEEKKDFNQRFGVEGFYDVDRSEAKEIKRAFSKHADHGFLSTLDTVHWTANPDNLLKLKKSSKDEISTTMHDRHEPFVGLKSYGLWIKGRITLASHDQDKIWSGFWKDYVGLTKQEHDLSDDERSSIIKSKELKRRTSGLRKLPKQGPTHANYERIISGQISSPYVLDAESWTSGKQTGTTNEALVVHWKPVGLIINDNFILMALKKALTGIDIESDGLARMAVPIIKAAEDFIIPIFDADRRIVWKPDFY